MTSIEHSLISNRMALVIWNYLVIAKDLSLQRVTSVWRGFLCGLVACKYASF